MSTQRVEGNYDENCEKPTEIDPVRSCSDQANLGRFLGSREQQSPVAKASPNHLAPEQVVNSPAELGKNAGSAFDKRSADFPVTVAEWHRNARKVVRVTIDIYNGKHTINVRVRYRDHEELKPGKSGITLALKHLPALASALVEAETSARNLGLVVRGEQ